MKSRIFKKILPTILAIMGCFIAILLGARLAGYFGGDLEFIQEGNYAQIVQEQQVVIYTRLSCPYCQSLKAFLDKRGIEYLDKDIELSQEALAEYQALKLEVVPVLYTKDTRYLGYNKKVLEEGLAELMSKQEAP